MIQSLHSASMQTKNCTIAANFTAEPILEPLNFWLRKLSLPVSMQFAPYDHIIQLLLRPSASIDSDFTVLLVQLERWLKTDPNLSSPGFVFDADYFCDALSAASKSSLTHFFVFICPISPPFIENTSIIRAKATLIEKIATLETVDLIISEQMYE